MNIFEFSFTSLLGLLGTFAFAVSGIRMAATRKNDWFGAYIIGLVTAIGGGTVRDLLLNERAFWMLDPMYITVTGLALLVTVIFKDKILKLGKTLFLFDTIGLGLFTVVGITKSVEAGLPFWVCIIMGAITGTVGGVIRDVLLNKVPLLFQRDIYALASIAGGIVYFGCVHFNVYLEFIEITATVTVISLRLIAVKYHIHLPKLEDIK